MLHDWQREGVQWALRTGRCALFWDCGLGKTFAQVEWARLSADTSLIVAPLSVARQTVREARKLDVDVRYVRAGAAINGPGVWITNYEMVDRFDPAQFGAVVLDESSILKNVDGKTRRALTTGFATVPRRLACTATPAPNDVAELTNHAEFLGVMSRAEMLAAYFINDEKDWRLKGHAAAAMFRWMSTWAHALRSPSDMGYPDDGYVLPALNIGREVVDAHITPEEGQMFATDLGGVGGRASVRRQTLAARVARAAQLTDHDEQAIVWCALNDEATAVAAVIDGAVNVEGSWAPDDKAQALEAFQDGEIRVLVTKPKIAGFGMNFQNCHHMIFLGLGDSYEAYYQAIRRCWRFGQTHPVDVRIVVSAIEQQIVNNVVRKQREATRWTDALVRASHPALEAA
ncbi:MAG: DEAD/DEAH box helicase [Chloroflexi bacterium]|nr:DEAD/DEAH box helicase [Chloroflexota bacterium]